YGAATDDGKEAKIELASPKKGDKADEITVKDIHLCCPQCKNAVKALFKDATVEFPEKNQAKITAKGLDKSEVMDTLRKAGFNGKIEEEAVSPPARSASDGVMSSRRWRSGLLRWRSGLFACAPRRWTLLPD